MFFFLNENHLKLEFKENYIKKAESNQVMLWTFIIPATLQEPISIKNSEKNPVFSLKMKSVLATKKRIMKSQMKKYSCQFILFH